MIVQRTGLAALLALLAPLAAAAETRFEVTRYQAEGEPLPDAAKLDALLQPLTGADRTVADLQSARAALEQHLRDEGHDFAVVQLPPQTLARGGVVTLKVLEYRIGRVTVDGAAHHDEANILRSLPALSAGAVPALGAIDAQLQLANSNPVKRTSVVMQPGLHETIDFAVQVQDARPWRIATTIDNTGSEETGELRFGLGFQHANLWNRDHIFSVQYVTAPHKDNDPDSLALPFEDDVRIFGASYMVPLPALRGAFELYGGSANVDSGVVADTFDITGSGSVLGGRFKYNLPTHRVWEQRLSLGYETRDYDNDVQLAGGSEQLIPDYRVSPLALAYEAEAQLAQISANVGLSLAQNVPSGSNSSAADFDAVRAGASRNYSVWRLNSGAQMGLGGAGELAFRLDGQYTSDLLVPGEQFGIGGVNSVRGLEERALIADRGLSASVEWLSPNLFPSWDKTLSRAVLFVDGATGQTIRPTALERGSLDIASVGAGLRFGNGRNISLRLDYGYLIDPDPDLETDSGRWHGGFSWFF